jgi:hypothetical protein
MDVLRQRQGAGRFNHHTPMGKGQSLAPLVLVLSFTFFRLRAAHYGGQAAAAPQLQNTLLLSFTASAGT